jgi:predicted nuclease of predicted toxin-antitoxin system
LVLLRANQIGALLLTSDKDFGELVIRDKRESVFGVGLLRLAGLSADRKVELVSSTVKAHLDQLQNRFTIITPGRVRFSNLD